MEREIDEKDLKKGKKYLRENLEEIDPKVWK